MDPPSPSPPSSPRSFFSAASLPPSASPTPSSLSLLSASSSSTVRNSSSTPRLGNFTKLQASIQAPLLEHHSDNPGTTDTAFVSPDYLPPPQTPPIPDEPVKLGNFSKIFSRLSATPLETNDNDTMATNMTSAQAPAAAAARVSPYGTPTKPITILTRKESVPVAGDVNWAQDHINRIVDMVTPHLSAEDPHSQSEADSIFDAATISSPDTTPPSSAEEKEPSPLARMAAKAAAPRPSNKATSTPKKTASTPKKASALSKKATASSFTSSPLRVKKPSLPMLTYQLSSDGIFIPVYDSNPRSRDKKHESLTMGLVPLRAIDSLVGKHHPASASNGIHVFLDMSNINISFHKTLRLRHHIPDGARFVPLPHLNLQFLTELLVRGRDAKVLNVACSVQPGRSTPQFVNEMRGLGYHVDIRERKAVTAHKRSGSGGYSSDEFYHPSGSPVRYVEDRVDETLQTRIGESAMAYFSNPGTFVFATGDGKPAEYSSGFFAYAERALNMGWNVEVVSWKNSLSSSWTNPAWTSQWGDRFRVIELDSFLDDLLAHYV